MFTTLGSRKLEGGPPRVPPSRLFVLFTVMSRASLDAEESLKFQAPMYSVAFCWPPHSAWGKTQNRVSSMASAPAISSSSYGMQSIDWLAPPPSGTSWMVSTPVQFFCRSREREFSSA